MIPVPIRCTAKPYPDRPGWVCNAVLTRAVPGTVEVRESVEIPPGCNDLVCTRCGTRYVACPVDRTRAA